jgi:hypothetical protein
MREQTIFFPWYAEVTRRPHAAPTCRPPDALHGGLLDFMRSGDHYRVGYRAAFMMRSDLALREVTHADAGHRLR